MCIFMLPFIITETTAEAETVGEIDQGQGHGQGHEKDAIGTEMTNTNQKGDVFFMVEETINFNSFVSTS